MLKKKREKEDRHKRVTKKHKGMALVKFSNSKKIKKIFTVIIKVVLIFFLIDEKRGSERWRATLLRQNTTLLLNH